jgi:putative Holliday junction resolvase
MGLDIGDKRIGVAISDPLETLASPFTTVQRISNAVAISAILDIVKREEIDFVIAGIPISLDGSLGAQAKDVSDFTRELDGVLPVSVEQWDERYSTVEAERLLREAGYSSRDMRQRVDAVAASIILQSYLDHKQKLEDERST